jgi:hypothetical protein
MDSATVQRARVQKVDCEPRMLRSTTLVWDLAARHGAAATAGVATAGAAVGVIPDGALAVGDVAGASDGDGGSASAGILSGPGLPTDTARGGVMTTQPMTTFIRSPLLAQVPRNVDDTDALAALKVQECFQGSRALVVQ